MPAPDRSVHLLTAEQSLPDGIAAWRTSDDGASGPDPDILPFDDRIGSGILAVDMRGATGVHDALTLATARADGTGDTDLGSRHSGNVLASRVRMARHTPLTGLGTAPGQAQAEATSQGGLTAGFREALGAGGSQLPAQSSARLLGQSHTADSRLYAKMHRRGAWLLAVENKPRMEAMQRAKTSDALEAGITDNVEGVAGTAPLAGNSNAGVTNPGGAVPIGGSNDGTALKGATDTTLGTHVKVVTDRSMLFAVPVTWLAVAEVDHRITDSRPFRALGAARRGPRAAEAGTTALIWLREDIARDYGLLDDSSFPAEASAAWDDMAKAAADLATAEKEYYDARARTREAWLSLSPAERSTLGDPPLTTVLPRSRHSPRPSSPGRPPATTHGSGKGAPRRPPRTTTGCTSPPPVSPPTTRARRPSRSRTRRRSTRRPDGAPRRRSRTGSPTPPAPPADPHLARRRHGARGPRRAARRRLVLPRAARRRRRQGAAAPPARRRSRRPLRRIPR